jgi:two-component system sensor histidine kinase AtoS
VNTLNFATVGLLAILLAIVLLFIVVFIKAIKVASGRGARREAGGESAMLSMALQEALTRLQQQQRATAARAEASERLSEQIVEGLTSGLVVVDRGGIVQAINPAARRILELIEGGAGMSFRDALKPATELSDLIAEAIESTSPIVRRTITLGGARPRHLGVTVSPIIGSEGDLQALVCLFTDLTAVVELEEQLRLKEALARLGELTAGLAHEFRNGLATIHGYGRLLDPATLPEPARTCVDGIRSETVALGEVVTNFLRFARPDQMILAPVELRAVITRAVDDVPNASSAVRLDGSFGTVSGDDVLLRQAFSNLIRNSLEACADGGLAPKVTVRGDVTGSDVHVIVEDNGPGFTPESLRKVFQPFATTKAHGTGLGLAIVQKVIVSHNGLITAANRAGGGAQFRVRLPSAKQA